MKKNIMIVLSLFLALSVVSFSQAKKGGSLEANLNAIEAQFENLLRLEEQKKREVIAEKEKLEREVEELKNRLVGREELEEKLQKESEVRWYRDEYKKVLKNYDNYYNNITKTINQKEKRIEELEMILAVIN